MKYGEALAYWLAISFYALAFVVQVSSIVFKREKGRIATLALIYAALTIHGVSLILRWFRLKHAPLVDYYESVSLGSWLAMFAFIVIQRRQRPKWILSSVMLPVTFLMMGSAMLTYRETSDFGPGLDSWWLVIHVIFALSAYVAVLVACGSAVLYLAPAGGKTGDGKDWDSFSRQFMLLAFIFQAVMIVSGSIWANQAWGSYWGWDPVETFSLLTLLIYGLYFHLRKAYGWKGKKTAWFVILTLLATVFCIWGVPYFFTSIHFYQRP